MEAIKVVLYNVSRLSYDVWKQIEAMQGGEQSILFLRYEVEGQQALTSTDSKVVILAFLGEEAGKTWEFIREFKRTHPEIPVLLMAPLDSTHVTHAAVLQGVEGLLSEKNSLETLCYAVQVLARREKYFNAQGLIDLAQWDPQLLERDRKILQMLARELDRARIAKALQVGVRTLDQYLIDLRARLRVRTNIGLAIYAKQIGLV